MNLYQYFEKIVNIFPLQDIFSVGLYHKFDNVERVYLDDLIKNVDDKYEFLLSFLLKKLNFLLDDQFYVCIVSYSEENLISFPEDDLENLKSNNIILPHDYKYTSKYDESEEWYGHYIFYMENKENTIKYVKGILAPQYRSGESYLSVDVFFISSDQKKVINIYDDRGMDILSLESLG